MKDPKDFNPYDLGEVADALRRRRSTRRVALPPYVPPAPKDGGK